MGRNIAPKTTEGRLADLEKRVAALEHRQPAALAFSDGNAIRARVGKHGDGKFGLRVWNGSGSLVIDQTA